MRPLPRCEMSSVTRIATPTSPMLKSASSFGTPWRLKMCALGNMCGCFPRKRQQVQLLPTKTVRKTSWTLLRIQEGSISTLSWRKWAVPMGFGMGCKALNTTHAHSQQEASRWFRCQRRCREPSSRSISSARVKSAFTSEKFSHL